MASGLTITQTWQALASLTPLGQQALVGLMGVTLVLYAASGLATAAGQTWAPGLFFSGFVGEIGLRLAVASEVFGPAAPGIDIATRVEAALARIGLVVEATPLTLATLLALGLCILATGVWRGQKGSALTRDWTRPPVWA